MHCIRGAAIALLAALATACGSIPGATPDEQAVRIAGAELEQLPAPTTTTVVVTTTSSTSTTTTTTTTRPAPTTTTTIRTAPVSATATSGDTTMTLSASAAGVKVTVSTPGYVASVRFDLGDGTVAAVAPARDTFCPVPSPPFEVAAPAHAYRAPGRYVVRATATLYPCVFLHGPAVPLKLPSMGQPPTLVEAAVTYQQG